MSVLVPAILPKNREDLERQLSAVYGLVDSIQIDSVDGIFAAPATWPYEKNGVAGVIDFGTEEKTLPYLGSFEYEIDFMVRDPITVVGQWVDAGAGRIVLHAESTNYLAQAIAEIQVRYGHEKNFALGLISLGIAINVNTDLAVMEPFLDRVDFVQFMGIKNIGKQGELFDNEVIRKIKQFRTKYPDLQTQVDGGVSLETAGMLLDVGVSRLVVGSALWKSQNVGEEIQKFHELIAEHGMK